MDDTTTREDRLPKWAQQELARLRSDVEHWKAKVASGPEDSDTFAHPYPGPPMPLGSGARVRYVLGHYADTDRERFMEAHLVDGQLRVTASDGYLVVLPSSSNSVNLLPMDYEAVKAQRGGQQP